MQARRGCPACHAGVTQVPQDHAGRTPSPAETPGAANTHQRRCFRYPDPAIRQIVQHPHPVNLRPAHRNYRHRPNTPQLKQCRGLRAMPEDHIGFQGGHRRRRRIAALDDARPIRVQSSRRDRIDCRGAGRNRVARIERQYLATDDGRHERSRGAPFGSDRQNRPSGSR
jgi:hypothetical protein